MTPYAQSETPSPSPSMAAIDLGMTPSLGHGPDVKSGARAGEAFSPQSPALETPSFEVDKDDIEQLLDPFPIPVSASISVFAPEDAELREGITQAELEGYDTSPLDSKDVRADPILASLAAKQSITNLKATATATASSNINHPDATLNLATARSNTSRTNEPLSGEGVNVPFRAKSVPSSTNMEGLGPRMTKSAALRLGLNWEAEKEKSRAIVQLKEEERQGKQAEEIETPGHRRVGLGITVPSLAAPSITPKPTKASLLRATGEKGSGLWPEPPQPKSTSWDTSIRIKTREELAMANKEKERLERLAKRKSLGINLASLNEPAVLVRQNKTSQLRATGEIGGGLWPAPGSSSSAALAAKEAEKKDREMSVLANRERERLAREERRKTLSVGIAALAEPSILVKGNKTSKLREIGEKGAELWHEPKSSLATQDEEQNAKRQRETIALANKAKERSARHERRKTLSISAPIAALSQPMVSVRGNKTSELRATREQGNGLWPDREKVVRSANAARIREDTAKERKEMERLERLERRKSFAPPISLGKPSITPRTNKTSLLRTNSQKSVPTTASVSASGGVRRPTTTTTTTTFSRSQSAASLTRTISTSALRATNADNVETKVSKRSDNGRVEYIDDDDDVGAGAAAPGEVVKPRTAVKSLGTPSNTPRLNRTAMLRTAGKSASSMSTPSSASISHRKAASIATALVSASPSKTKSKAVAPTPTSPGAVTPRRPITLMGDTAGVGPRPNKTSLLRAQMQAQMQAQKEKN
ncbi:hypothetical protein IAT40_004454 [Kwoniella sp. CBS 6097]